MKHIDISIIITNYNKSKYIDRAIRSCINQIIFKKNIEIIVVDDCSTDNSLDIISEFKEDINILTNNINKGVAFSSNLGLSKASGKYFIRVDADDYISTLATEIFSQILDNNEDLDYVYADHYRVDTRGLKIEKVQLNTLDSLYRHGAGILMRTSALNKIGGYDEELRNCEDFDLILRLQKSGSRGYYLPLPLYRYYIHGDNMTLTSERSDYWTIVEKKHGI